MTTDYSKIENLIEFDLADEKHESASAAAIDIEIPEEFVAEEATVAKRKRVYSSKPVKRHMGQKATGVISNIIIYIILVIISVIWLLPFFGIVFESFRMESTTTVGYIFPKQWGFGNYVRLFTDSEIKFGRWLLNTFSVGLVVSVLQTAFVLAMSYVLSRFVFKGRKFLMNFMLILGMFPGFLTLILMYNLLSGWGLTEEMSPVGLTLVYVASSGMGYYISKGYFDTISKSLDEAARIDGATRAQVFFKIILPLAKPIVIYTVLMGFMAPWGDFIMAQYLAHSVMRGYNVAVGLQWMISTPSNKSSYYTTFCAGGVVVAIPITTLFMCLQKYYVAGVTGGAVKG